MAFFTCNIYSGQIIATSHDLTPNGGLVGEIPVISGKSRLVKYYNLARYIPPVSKTLEGQPTCQHGYRYPRHPMALVFQGRWVGRKGWKGEIPSLKRTANTPENEWLEYWFPFWDGVFSGAMLVSGRVHPRNLRNGYPK